MKIYYVANARIPSEKAHAIQIAKMCEAFILAGENVTLVVPGRITVPDDVQAAYNLKVSVPLVRLSVPNIYEQGRFGFFIASLCFMFSYCMFFLEVRAKREPFLIYTVDMDNFSNCLLPWWGKVVTEMHTPKPANNAESYFFARAAGVIATNKLIKESIVKTFALPDARVAVEPNGVDLAQFAPADMAAARAALSLPIDKKIAVYVGRFYQWKGLEILPAAAETPAGRGLEWYVVGGSEDDFRKITDTIALPGNLHVVAPQEAQVVAQWIAAADAVVVLGTAKNQDSYRYTSPMKIFEYMAAKRPVVASRTPALVSILSEQEVFFYEPDDALSLGVLVATAAISSPDTLARVERARLLAQEHTWTKRAMRILAFIKGAVTLG